MTACDRRPPRRLGHSEFSSPANLFLTLTPPSGESLFLMDTLRRVSSWPDRNMLREHELALAVMRAAGLCIVT
jgi:hypothetical protein